MKVDPSQPLNEAKRWLSEHAGRFPVEPLVRATRLATGLSPVEITRPLAPGASHFGGVPDLPPAASWPRWSKGPLSFLAQLDLASLPDGTGLVPTSGTLFFFYDMREQPWGFDPAHEGAARVIYSEAETRALTPAAFPEDLPKEARFKPRGLESRLVATLPTDAERAGVDLDAYDDDDAFDEYAELETGVSGQDRQHRVLGWPAEIQNPMEFQCQLASNGVYCGNASGYQSEAAQRLAAGADEWMLLLQLDSDEAMNWTFGDEGRLYFWIKKGHLAARRFDRVWTILQCG